MSITLSVCVVAYNHEEYIKKCIDSILSQEIDFNMEILVGNDCSTDCTAQVLEKEYGNKIRVINRTENLGLCGNMRDLLLRASGKYVFLFSGDDFLLVKNMLAKEVDFLENNPEYFSVSARNYGFIQNENKWVESKARCGTWTIEDFLMCGSVPCIQGTMRNIFAEDKENNLFLASGARNNEEIKLWTYVLDKGNKYIFDECMHAYRVVQKKDGGNYCSRVEWLDLFFDYYTDIRIVESIYGKKYKFMPLKMEIINRYLLIVGNSIKKTLRLLGALTLGDFIYLFYYKIYLKMHHYQKPSIWNKKKYYIR